MFELLKLKTKLPILVVSILSVVTASTSYGKSNIAAMANYTEEELDETFNCYCYEKVISWIFHSESRGRELGKGRMPLREVLKGGNEVFCEDEFPGSLPGMACTADGDPEANERGNAVKKK